MNYKVKSVDTTKYINLHDCVCDKMYMNGSDLTLEMEWMEVEAEHPENPDDKARSSDKGLIVLEDIIILDTDSETEIKADKSFQGYSDAEIMGFYETAVNSVYRYGTLDFFDESNNFVCITFLFKKSIVMWNELKDISWFEDRKFKHEPSIEEILKMLSWNNSSKVQKQGIKLAEKLNYPGYLFQPVIGEESKSMWENCALVLKKKSDEQLQLWLIDCFIWLQDMNWPGAEIIADRLKLMRGKEVYEYNKQKAVKIAELTKDEEWLDNLNKYL